MQEDGNQSPLSAGEYERLLSNINNQVGEYFGPYVQREPDSRLMGLLASADLNGLKSYFKPDILYYRAFPNRLPITSLVLAFAQRSVHPTMAAMEKYHPILQFLLEKGARPDAKDTLGQTALHYAVMTQPMPSLAQLLLEHGADPNTQNRIGATPLLNAVQYPYVRPLLPSWHSEHISEALRLYRNICMFVTGRCTCTSQVHLTTALHWVVLHRSNKLY